MEKTIKKGLEFISCPMIIEQIAIIAISENKHFSKLFPKFLYKILNKIPITNKMARIGIRNGILTLNKKYPIIKNRKQIIIKKIVLVFFSIANHLK